MLDLAGARNRVKGMTAIFAWIIPVPLRSSEDVVRELLTVQAETLEWARVSPHLVLQALYDTRAEIWRISKPT